jgi:hypothetical protein
MKFMTRAVVVLTSVWLWAAGPAWAAPHVLMVEPSGVAISLLEAWGDHFEVLQPGDAQLTSASPRVLVVKRQAITDPAGRQVIPGLNVTTFRVPPGDDANTATVYAAALMGRRHWPMTEPLTGAKDGIRIPNSLAFHTHFPVGPGVEMDALVLFEVNNGMFTEVIVSATPPVFQQIEPELRGIMRDIRVDGTAP